MPRFGLKSLLIGVTLVALWCSTFSGYTGAEDVRAFVMTAALMASGVAAYSYRARWRAFWLGFFGTMLVTGGRQHGVGLRRQGSTPPRSAHLRLRPAALSNTSLAHRLTNHVWTVRELLGRVVTLGSAVTP